MTARKYQKRRNRSNRISIEEVMIGAVGVAVIGGSVLGFVFAHFNLI